MRTIETRVATLGERLPHGPLGGESYGIGRALDACASDLLVSITDILATKIWSEEADPDRHYRRRVCGLTFSPLFTPFTDKTDQGCSPPIRRRTRFGDGLSAVLFLSSICTRVSDQRVKENHDARGQEHR